jgi:serine/threonine protein kinase
LGHGAHGDVLEVEHEGNKYAAKRYTISEGFVLGTFGREHEILARIKHPNIVPYYGICTLASDKSTVIVMQKLHMDLNSFLNVNKNISLERKIQILNDIIRGLHHLHNQKPAILHRDLTAGNVLLHFNGTAKLCDFGNSRMVDLMATPEILTCNPGTYNYMPPEALKGGEYNEKMDVFSFGHLSIHVIIQRRPHPLLRHTYTEAGRLIPRTEVQRRQVYLEEVKSNLDGGDSHPLYSLIISCLEDELSQRPSAADILRHSPFAELNT